MTPESLDYAAARARVLAAAPPLPAVHLPIAATAGRALRETLFAPHGLPPHRDSAMDGWAVRAAEVGDAAAGHPVMLPVVGEIPAGRPAEHPLPRGAAFRIMTGGVLPDGADAVVPFEQGERLAGPERAAIRAAVRPGQNVRAAGADIAAGALVLEAGRTLSAHDVALAGALGFAALHVSPVLRAVVLSTGDELRDLGTPLEPGTIRDTNGPLLARLLTEVGVECLRLERLPDDSGRVAEGIEAALRDADVVLSIGGVSAGDHDPVKQALDRIGDVGLWRVAMRPGRPQAFGTPLGRLYFGLPGNPASVTCVFEALVRPALRARMGHAALDRPAIPVRVATPVESHAGRTDFVRVVLEWRGETAWATPAGSQVSGHLTPQSRAHALLVVPDEVEGYRPGDAAVARVLRLPD